MSSNERNSRVDSLAEKRRRERAADRLDREREIDVSRDDVDIMGGRLSLTDQAQARAQRRREQRAIVEAAQKSDRYNEGDLTVANGEVVPTAAAVERERQEALREAASELPEYSAGDLSTEDGEVQLTDEAIDRERREALQKAAEQSERYTVDDLVYSGDSIEAVEQAVERERQEARSNAIAEAAEASERWDKSDLTVQDGQIQPTDAALEREFGDVAVDSGDIPSGGALAPDERAAQQLSEDLPIDVNPNEVAVSDGQATLVESAQDRLAEARAAEQFDSQIDATSIDRFDVRETDEGFALTDDARQEVRDAQIDDAVQQFDESLPLFRVNRDDVMVSDGQVQPTKEFAAKRISTLNPDLDVGPDDIVRAGDSFRISADVAAEQFGPEFSPDDVAFANGQPVLEEKAKRREAAEDIQTQLSTELGIADAPDVGLGDLTETSDGYQLNAETRRQIRAERAEDRVGDRSTLTDVSGIAGEAVSPVDFESSDITAGGDLTVDARLEATAATTEFSRDELQATATFGFDRTGDPELKDQQVQVSPEELSQRRREAAAEQFESRLSEQLGPDAPDVAPDDVTIESDGVALDESLQNVVRQRQRERAAEQLESSIASTPRDRLQDALSEVPDQALGGETPAEFADDVLPESDRSPLDISLDRGDVAITDSGVDLTESGVADIQQAQRERAATRFDAALEAQFGDFAPDVRQSDLSERDGQLVLDEDARTEVQQAQRQQAASSIEMQLSNDLGEDIDIGPSDLSETGDGFRLDQDARRRATAASLDAQVDSAKITPASLIRVDPPQDSQASASDIPEFRLAADVEKQITRTRGAEQIESQLTDRLGDDAPDITPEDIDVSGGTASLDDETTRAVAREQAADDLSQQFDAEIQPGDDFSLSESEDGGFSVDPVAGSTLARELEAQARDESTSGTQSFVGGLVSGAEDVTGVDVPGEGSVIEQGIDLGASTAQPFDTLPLDPAESALSDAGDVVSETVINPTADVAGDVADLARTGARLRLAADPLAAGGSPQNPEGAAADIDPVREVRGADREVADLFRGSQAELEAPSGTESFATNFVSGAGEIANPPRLGRTVLEAGDFTATGVESLVTGDFDDFASATTQAGAAAGATVTTQAVENPGQFGAVAAGSLVGSVGAIRGAQTLGGARTARAVSAGIQPGEEAVRAAVRSGTLPLSVGRAVPGVRRGQFDPDDVDTISTETQTDLDTDQFRVDFEDGPDRAPFAEVRDRAPSVRLEQDAEAGLLEIDPLVKQQVREATVGRARAGGQTLVDAPGEFTTGVRAGRSPDAVDLDDFDSGLAFRSGERIGRTERSVRTAPGRLRDAFEDPTVDGPEQFPEIDLGLSRRLSDLRERASGTPRQVARASPAVTGDVALQQSFIRGSEFPEPDFRAGAARARDRLESVLDADSPLSAPSLGFGLGFPSPSRPSLDVSRPDITGRIADAGREAALRSPSNRGDIALQLAAMDPESEVPFPSFPQRGEADSRRFERLSERGRAAAQRVRNQPREFASGFALGSGRVDITSPDRLGPETDQITPGRTFEAGARAGRAEARARAMLSVDRADEPLSERLLTRLDDARDTTIRVERGVPGRPVPVDDADIRMDFPEELRNEFDFGPDADSETQRTGSSRDPSDGQTGRLMPRGSSEIDREAGVTVERVIARPEVGTGESGIVSPADAAGELGSVEPGLGLLDPEAAPTDENQLPEVGESDPLPFGRETTPGIGTELGRLDRIRTDLGARPGARLTPGLDERLATRERTRLDTRQEPRLEPLQDSRLDTRQEIRQEFRTEGRLESLFENRFEVGTEPRTEPRIEPVEQPRFAVDPWIEITPRPDTTPEPQPEPFPDSDDDPLLPGGSGRRDPPSSRTETTEDETATGYLSETIATIATGGSVEAATAPSADTLREQPLDARLTGELPTTAFLSGDEQTQEAIEETQDLLGGFGVDFGGER